MNNEEVARHTFMQYLGQAALYYDSTRVALGLEGWKEFEDFLCSQMTEKERDKYLPDHTTGMASRFRSQYGDK